MKLQQKTARDLASYDITFYARGYQVIAGVDEAGRGPLAGPVVAAACIVPRGFFLDGVNDSKKLTPARREKLYDSLISSDEVLFSVGIIEPLLIDKINILQATFRAMIEAVDGLKKRPEYLLVDGNQLPPFTIPAEAIVEGDGYSQLIAIASIIAKCERDNLMCQLDKKCPEYRFAQNKGYGTKQHMKAIEEHGPSPHHRLSFAPFTKKSQLDFLLN